ncbi:MAG: YybS family protein [Deltaproteobacteria bacterium]|nr:YybS family protein [Deltaproteobacteria bacterium]
MEREKGALFHSDMIRGGAILTLTFLFVALIPFIGPVVVILTPLPILYYCSRLGRRNGLVLLTLSLLATCGILGLLGQGTNLPVLSMIGFAGVLLSEVLKRHLSFEKTFLLASLALFCCGAGFVLYHAFRTGIAPWRMLELYVAGIVRENIKLYAQLNISEEQVRLIRESAPQITYLFTGIFPALALSGAVFTVWVNLLAGRLLFRRTGLPFPDFGDLAAWKAPERLVWILIAAGGMVIVPLEGAAIVGMNLLILCGLIYLFQGLAIAAFFFRQKQVPAMFRWLFYALLLVQQYMLIIVIAFGLFDMWVDFRKRIGGIKNSPV